MTSVVLPALLYHAGVSKEVRKLVEHPEKKLLDAVHREKSSMVERPMFQGFAKRVMKAIDDDEDLVNAMSSLSGNAKPDRPPRAAYARPEMSRTLVDQRQ